jgi:hypothetical protein
MPIPNVRDQKSDSGIHGYIQDSNYRVHDQSISPDDFAIDAGGEKELWRAQNHGDGAQCQLKATHRLPVAVGCPIGIADGCDYQSKDGETRYGSPRFAHRP